MRVLVDTNIILDFLLEREPFLHDAEALFQVIGSGQVVGYISDIVLSFICNIAHFWLTLNQGSFIHRKPGD